MRRNSHRHCERSEATRGRLTRPLGCFVASLLAMTIQFFFAGTTGNEKGRSVWLLMVGVTEIEMANG